LISWRFCFSRRNNFLSSRHLFLVAIVFKIPNLHPRKFLKKFLFQHNSYFDQWKGRSRGKKLNFLLLLALQVLKKDFSAFPLIISGHFCVYKTTTHCASYFLLRTFLKTLISSASFDLHLLNVHFSRPTTKR